MAKCRRLLREYFGYIFENTNREVISNAEYLFWRNAGKRFSELYL